MRIYAGDEELNDFNSTHIDGVVVGTGVKTETCRLRGCMGGREDRGVGTRILGKRALARRDSPMYNTARDCMFL